MKKNVRGSITIFLIIIMLPSFMFGGYIIDYARLDAAKTMISSAGDLTLTSALTEYNENLFKLYGLLATNKDPSAYQEALSNYFDSMIEGYSILQGTDSDTQNTINNIKNYIKNQNSDNYDNWVKMSTNNTSIKGVENTTLMNPDIAKNQIIEYMKYRGPISLASGLITKIKTFGTLNEQTKAVEKKMDYENDLSNMAEVCQNAYKSINNYNQYLNDNNIQSLLQAMANTSSKINEISEILAYYSSTKNKVTKYSNNKISADTKSIMKQRKDEDRKQAFDYLYNQIRDYIDDKAYIDDAHDKKIYSKGKELKELKIKLNQALNADGLNRAKLIYETSILLENKYDDYNLLRYYYLEFISLYKEKYPNALNPNNSEEEKEDYRKYIEIYKFYQDSFTKHDSTIYKFQNDNVNSFEDIANTKLNQLNSNLKSVYSNVKTHLEKISDVKKKLNKIKSKLKSLEGKRNEYKKAVNNLPNGEYKTTMQSQYDNSAKNVNERQLNKLIDTFTEYENYLKSMKKSLDDGGTFYNHNLVNVHITNLTIGISKASNNKDVNDIKASIFNCFKPFKGQSSFNGKKPKKTQSSNSEFYSYLQTICKESKDVDEEKKSKEENALSQLLNSNLINSDSILNKNIEGNSSISSSNEIKNFEKGNYDQENSIKNILSYFSGLGSTLQSLTNITKIFDGANVRDSLYMMEYMTEMFSCYTDHSEPSIKLLSGYDLKKSNTPYYGAEIEYILSGQDTVKGNLNAVEGRIFALRFAFNLVYCMTSADIQAEALKMATALTGGNPFLLPIVKTVIICASAIGESCIDIFLLKNDVFKDKGVALMKTPSTYLCSLTGMKNLSDLAKEASQNLISDGVDMITDSLINRAKKGVQSLENSVNGYISKIESQIGTKIKGTIHIAIFEKATQIITDISHYGDYTIEKIRDELKSSLDKVKSSPAENNVAKSVRSEVIDMIDIDSIAQIIYKQKDNAINNLGVAIADIEKDINNKIMSTSKYITDKIESKLNLTKDELMSEIREKTKGYSQELKSKATEGVNEAIDHFNQKIGNISSKNETSNTGSSASGLTFTYKEYLKFFLLMECLDSNIGSQDSQRDKLLKRTINLIDQNCDDVDLKKAYTMISMKSSVEVKTKFLNVPIRDNGDGTKDFDFNNLTNKKYVYEFNSVKGY